MEDCARKNPVEFSHVSGLESAKLTDNHRCEINLGHDSQILSRSAIASGIPAIPRIFPFWIQLLRPMFFIECHCLNQENSTLCRSNAHLDLSGLLEETTHKS